MKEKLERLQRASDASEDDECEEEVTFDKAIMSFYISLL
jgi:hypothetical protein